MLKILTKWLKIYEDEISLFLWTTLLLFLIRSSNILFNNFAETAFLKRFGVEYLPVIFMINSVSTFFIMGLLTGIMARIPGCKMLFRMLVVCGVSVAGFRLLIPFGFGILYPVLYILKAQYEVLLALMFWNLANDLFNTRQSKRIFPLIAAGGVIGGVIGSFGTPILAETISMDNLMWAYLGTTLVGAFVVQRMGVQFPYLLLEEKKTKKTGKRSSLKEEFKKVFPLIKESDLVKILILLTLLPNVIIPIINYQFNFAIDATFATEGGMIKFFGYFRGVMNIVSFVILLFVGRIYGRWGLPIALMFHPINYILAFLGFLFRFDIFSAMYARLSTTVLRNTINNPARAVLMGLFPLSYRSIIRPFLRGTVVRIGTLLGSGFIILFEGIFHPRYLSVIAIVFGLGWVVTTFVLKRRYSSILLDLISNNMLDLKSLEADDVGHIFLDKGIQSQLIGSFLSSEGNTCLWYANLIRSLGMENLDEHILRIINAQDDQTKIGLLGLISSEAGTGAVGVLEDLIDPEKPELTVAAVKAALELPADTSSGFLKRVFDGFENPEVRAYALIGLYRQDPEGYQTHIDSWLASEDIPERKAGIIAAGGSKAALYIQVLVDHLEREEDPSAIALLLDALRILDTPEINRLSLPYLRHPSGEVRQAALGAMDISDDNAVRAVIPLLGDHLPDLQSLARERLHESSYQNPILLIESLAAPNRRVREELFSLLESLEIKDVDVFKFARSQLERAYRNLLEAESTTLFTESPERTLLTDHLRQKKDERVETVLRVLVTQDQTGQMRVIWRGIYSSDTRQKSNALEALEDTVGRALAKTMVPLLEDLPISQCLEVGKKIYQLPSFDANPRTLYNHLLAKHDWVTVVLTLNLMAREDYDELDREARDKIAQSDNPYIRQIAMRVADPKERDADGKETVMEKEISIPDKILHLRGIQIFEGLSVSELAAIASVTEEVVHPEGADVIKEGEQGETMFMITSGLVSVVKEQEGGHEIELDKIKAGDYFGEMALFEDQVRSATIRTKEETRLLVLHKREFNEIVREYPQIALHICQVLSHRMRRLHERVQKFENMS